MQKILAVTALAFLSVAPAFAQSGGADVKTASTKPAGHAWPKPVDNGPYTAEANRAYQGGGVILQSAPGAPAPAPQSTPPGQMPRNAVPQ